jgi:hypothetical protein
MTAYYIIHCTIPNRILKESKRQHYSRLGVKLDNKMEVRWDAMKHEAGNIHITEKLPSILIKSERNNGCKNNCKFF